MENNDIITRPNGQRYQYDSDFDVYRRIPEPHEFTHMSQFGWIYVCIVLMIIVGIVAR